MIDNNNFASFIEELRKSRNFSRKDFVEGIVSERQYYRFIKGESSLTNETISSLLEKLEINLIMAYEKSKKYNDENYNFLIAIYKYLYHNDLNNANRLFKQLDKDKIKSIFNLKFYKFIETRMLIEQKIINVKDGVQRIIEIIDYPAILEKDTTNFIETSGIMYISKYLVNNNDFRVASYSYNLIKKSENSDNNLVESYDYPFYITAAQNLGQIGEIEKSLYVAERGIDSYVYHNGLNFLTSMFYLKALSERDFHKDDRYKDTLKKLFSVLFIENNKKRIETMKKLILKNFNIVEDDLIIYK